jgi:hypothetical protein
MPKTADPFYIELDFESFSWINRDAEVPRLEFTEISHANWEKCPAMRQFAL